jgi:ribosomal protein S18 acetylase RimI-like enzyme
MVYTLRPATANDYDYLYALHVATIREAVTATWGWDEAFQRRYFEEHWDPGPRQVIVVDGEDVGVLQVEWYVNHVFLALIEVAPAWQGRGIGSAVIRDVQAQAREAELPVTLQVLKANGRAKALYERLGFRVATEQKERWMMEWEDG